MPFSFESAVLPCRTLCCSKLFCLEHIADVRRLPVVIFFAHLKSSGYTVRALTDAAHRARPVVH